MTNMRMLIGIAASGATILTAIADKIDIAGCHAEWEGTRLSVGNALFSREYSVASGRLRTVSFKDVSGREWQRSKQPTPNNQQPSTN